MANRTEKTRRAVLSAAAALATGAAVNVVVIAATRAAPALMEATNTIDPAVIAIGTYRAAQAKVDALDGYVDDDELTQVCGAAFDAHMAAATTSPTTIAGAAALAALLSESVNSEYSSVLLEQPELAGLATLAAALSEFARVRS